MTAHALRIAIAASLCIGTSATLPGLLRAQAEFAIPVPRGTVRLDITPDWLSYDHRFGLNVPGYADGSPVPISLDFSAESLTVAAMPFLGPTQDQIRAASGLGGFSLSLGRTVTQLNASIRTIPIGIEFGVTNRLAIGVTIPIVRSRMDANFAVDSTTGKRGNVAFADPALVAPFKSEMDAALAALAQQAQCGPDSLRAAAQAALTQLQPFGTLAGAPFLPLASSEAGDSIAARIAGAESAYQQLAARYAAAGVTLPPLTTSLALPDSAMTRADLERLLTDSTFPFSADTMGNAVRTGIGDISAHATWQFADGDRYRGQLLVTTQFPTGGLPYSRSYLDLGTGTHQMGVSVGLANDLILGSHFLVHAVGRAGGAKADEVERRVAPPGFAFVPLAQLATVKRSPGSWVGLDIQPTWMLDDAFSVRLSYSYFNQGRTHYSYVTAGDSARTGLPASVLDQETDMRLMRIGGGVTFSTLSRYLAGSAAVPYSVTVSYENTVWGRGGRVPQASIFRIQFRAYVRLFGKPASNPDSSPRQ